MLERALHCEHRCSRVGDPCVYDGAPGHGVLAWWALNWLGWGSLRDHLSIWDSPCLCRAPLSQRGCVLLSLCGLVQPAPWLGRCWKEHEIRGVVGRAHWDISSACGMESVGGWALVWGWLPS